MEEENTSVHILEINAASSLTQKLPKQFWFVAITSKLSVSDQTHCIILLACANMKYEKDNSWIMYIF